MTGQGKPVWVGIASPRPSPRLTPRQRELLAWTALGDSQKQVARRLGLSPHTVKNHLWSALHRLGARTVAHAVYLAYVAGEMEAGQ